MFGEEKPAISDETIDGNESEETSEKSETTKTDDEGQEKGKVDWNVTGPFFQNKYQETKQRLEAVEKQFFHQPEKDEPEPEPEKPPTDEGYDLTTVEGVSKFEQRIINQTIRGMNKLISERDRTVAQQQRIETEAQYATQAFLEWAGANKVPEKDCNGTIKELIAEFPGASPARICRAAQERIIAKAVTSHSRSVAEKREKGDADKREQLDKVVQPAPGNTPEPKTVEKDRSETMRDRFARTGKTPGAKFLGGQL